MPIKITAKTRLTALGLIKVRTRLEDSGTDFLFVLRGLIQNRVRGCLSQDQYDHGPSDHVVTE